jgi:hypothetical protein
MARLSSPSSMAKNFSIRGHETRTYLLLTAYSARGQLMCHEDASPNEDLMKTVLVLLGHLMPQHKIL